VAIKAITVEEVFEQLIEDEKFNRYLQAVYDEQRSKALSPPTTSALQS
jgi:hypothetical protein